jgi:hypothetical protein
MTRDNHPAIRAAREAAQAYAESLRDIVAPLATRPTREIARGLNHQGFRTSRGGLWTSMAVSRLLKKLELRK